eukprot:366129-Chlamydomonas_euryale.AAC.4
MHGRAMRRPMQHVCPCRNGRCCCCCRCMRCTHACAIHRPRQQCWRHGRRHVRPGQRAKPPPLLLGMPAALAPPGGGTAPRCPASRHGRLPPAFDARLLVRRIRCGVVWRGAAPPVARAGSVCVGALAVTADAAHAGRELVSGRSRRSLVSTPPHTLCTPSVLALTQLDRVALKREGSTDRPSGQSARGLHTLSNESRPAGARGQGKAKPALCPARRGQTARTGSGQDQIGRSRTGKSQSKTPSPLKGGPLARTGNSQDQSKASTLPCSLPRYRRSKTGPLAVQSGSREVPHSHAPYRAAAEEIGA